MSQKSFVASLRSETPTLPELYRGIGKKLDSKASLAQRLAENIAAKRAILSVIAEYARKIRTVAGRDEAVRLTQLGAKELLQRLGIEVDFQSEVSPEVLESTTPKLFVANHQGGGLETFLLPGILEQPFTWVLKDGLMSLPVFGSMMEKSKPIVINRSRPDLRKNGAEIADRLEKGENVLIFFEGTRSKDGAIGQSRLLAVLEKAMKRGAAPTFHKIGVMVDTFSVLPEPIEKKPFGSFRKEAGITVRLFDADHLVLEDAEDKKAPATLAGAFRVRLIQVLQEKLNRLDRK